MDNIQPISNEHSSKKFLIIGIIVLLAVVVTAAVLFLYPHPSDNPTITNNTGLNQNTTINPVVLANVSSEGIQTVVDANNKFAFELYSELNKNEQSNLFYSPYSISAALAMTYEGAKGKTASEMKDVFHFPEIGLLRPNFASIYNNINSKSEVYQLKTGNALWVQQDYPFIQEYMTTVEKYYGGKATNMDFIGEPDESRKTINSYIEEQTNNKIKDLLPEGSINDMTRMILTNAIYFKGTWEWQFDKSDTQDWDFKITPENIVKTPMMYMNPEKTDFNYANTDDLQILELPYKGDKISMLIILPKENLASLGEITADNLKSWTSQMQETHLDSISMPKFEFDTKYTLNDYLIALGMPTAFEAGKADFTGMANLPDEKLYIDFVIHQAYVKVDEEGTEAAAATAVGMMAGSAGPTEQKIFRADHPFIFIIQEKDTGNILFLGKVVDPR
jgi:serine protease inhibitor